MKTLKMNTPTLTKAFNKNMKPIITLAILFLSIGINAQTTDCSDFKTGKFTYPDTNAEDFVIHKTVKYQLASFPKKGWEVASKITWLSDCSYQLEHIGTNNPQMEAIIGMKYVVNIVKINGNSVTLRAEAHGKTAEKELVKLPTK